MNVRDAGVGSALPAASIARTSKRVLAVVERRGRVRRGAGSRTRRRRRGTRSGRRPRGAEREGRRGIGDLGPPGPLVIVVLGGSVSTVKVREAGVASVLPAASVGAHLERVLAVGEPLGRERRVAGGVGAAVDAALEASRRARRRERRTSASCRWSGPPGPPSIVVSRRVGVDGERARRRGLVDVARGVGGAHLERVLAVGERGRSGAATRTARTAPPSTRHSNVAPASSAERRTSASCPSSVR